MLKAILLILACLCLGACARDLTPEQQAYKIARAQALMSYGSMLQQQGQYLTTPAINRYYFNPGYYR